MKRLIDRIVNRRHQDTEDVNLEPNTPVLGEDVRELFQNRRRVGYEQLRRELSSALDRERLQRSGGLLFQAVLVPPALHFGMLPAFIEGERGYHYDIHLKMKDNCTLIGTISSSRVLTLLYKIPQPDDEQRRRLHATYQVVARLLLDAAVEPITPDEITLGILGEYAIYSSVPDDINGMAQMN